MTVLEEDKGGVPIFTLPSRGPWMRCPEKMVFSVLVAPPTSILSIFFLAIVKLERFRSIGLNPWSWLD